MSSETDLAKILGKAKVPLNWLLATACIMLSVLASAFFVGGKLELYKSRLEASEQAAIEYEAGKKEMFERLLAIDQRLSRIEGQLELIRSKLIRIEH